MFVFFTGKKTQKNDPDEKGDSRGMGLFNDLKNEVYRKSLERF